MKKRTFKIILILSFIIFLGGCVREEFTDLYGFTERFTLSELSPEDFYTEKTDDGSDCFYTFFDTDNPQVMLKLICSENNKIGEIRIYLPKYDENASIKALSTDSISLFIKAVSSSLQAFTGYSENITEDIITQLQLYERKAYENVGELTKTKDNFHFVYHSASLGSEFIIYNTYLTEVPETEKPESRPMYGDTTKIRTETAPIK